jgi:hypothetical protein
MTIRARPLEDARREIDALSAELQSRSAVGTD